MRPEDTIATDEDGAIVKTPAPETVALAKTLDDRVVLAGTPEAAFFYKHVPVEEAVALGVLDGDGEMSVDDAPAAPVPTAPHIPVSEQLLEEYSDGEWKGPFLLKLGQPTEDGKVDLSLKAVDPVGGSQQKGGAEVETPEGDKKAADDGATKNADSGGKKAPKPADKKSPAPKNK